MDCTSILCDSNDFEEIISIEDREKLFPIDSKTKYRKTLLKIHPDKFTHLPKNIQDEYTEKFNL